MSQFKYKLLDHCFEAGKSLLTIFVGITTLYIAFIVATFAVLYAEPTPIWATDLRVVAIAATIGVGIILVVCHYAVQKAVRYYLRLSESLGEASELVDLERAGARVRLIGQLLFGFGLTGLSSLFATLILTLPGGQP